MRYIFPVYLFCFILQFNALAQVARIQWIHNCADAQASVVDIYVDGVLLHNNFSFRTSTPFADIMAESSLDIAVADSGSTGASMAFATFTHTFMAGEKYLAVLGGIVSNSGYVPSPEFTIDFVSGAKETGTENSSVDIMFYNGCTDAPATAIEEYDLLLLTLEQGLSYQQHSSYISLLSADYALLAKNALNSYNYLRMNAPFGSMNLGGKAVTLLASGFLSTTQNNGGPGYGWWLTSALGGPLVHLNSETARVQLINNSADQAADTMDVYANGILVANDLAFRYATPYLTMPADIELSLAFAPAQSTSDEDAMVMLDLPVLLDDETYCAVANGIFSETGYNPAPPFEISLYAGAREQADTATETHALLMHGSTDTPSIDIQENQFQNITVVNNISYSQFSGYFEFPTFDVQFDIADDSGEEILATYNAPFLTLGLQGAAVTIVVSGFADPLQNSNGPSMGLWLAKADGGALTELTQIIIPPVFARAQFIHNCADALASVVDVYFNNVLVANDMGFRSATAYMDVPAQENLAIGFAPQNSVNSNDVFASYNVVLDENETYIMMATGIISATGYNPAPPFQVLLWNGATELAADNNETDAVFVNAGTDSPPLNITELLQPDVLASNLSFAEFSSYINLLNDFNYAIQFYDQNNVVNLGAFSFISDNINCGGQTATIFTSGFLNPSNNSNGPSWQVWVACANGYTAQLTTYQSISEMTNLNNTWIYPNPVSEWLNVQSHYNELTLCNLLDASGRTVWQAVQPAGASKMEINVSALPQGIYTIYMCGNDISEAIRFQISDF